MGTGNGDLTWMRINLLHLGNASHIWVKLRKRLPHSVPKCHPYERSCELIDQWPASPRLIHIISYNTPGARAPDLKKLHSFAVQARRELEVWRSQLPEVLAVNLLNLENIHPPHVLQLQYVLEEPFIAG